MDSTFLQSRIDAIKLRIVAYEEVLLKLAANPAKSYTISTGQTSETVSRLDIASIEAQIQQLISQLDSYESLLNGNGTIIVTPGF